MVQRRAARYVANRYHNTSSVTPMLDHLEWESLEARRTKSQLTVLFKIISDLVDIPQEEYLKRVSKRTRTRHSHKFRQIPASSDYYLNSFFPKTVRLWNSLPASVADAPSLVLFKRELSTISFKKSVQGQANCSSWSCKWFSLKFTQRVTILQRYQTRE